MLNKRAMKAVRCLGNIRRIEILSLLAKQSMCVEQLTKEMNLSQSACSQHLLRLRQAELVKCKIVDVHKRFYFLNNPNIPEYLNAVRNF